MVTELLRQDIKEAVKEYYSTGAMLTTKEGMAFSKLERIALQALDEVDRLQREAVYHA